MAKFEEALKRNYSRRYVCKKCGRTIKADPMKVVDGKIKCRNPRCNAKKLRSPRKK